MGASATAFSRRLAYFFAIFLASACAHQAPSFEECFYRFEPKEGARLVADLSPEIQMRLFLYGVANRRPAERYLAEPIARSAAWRDLVPLIIEKIEEPVAWNERFHLLLLVREMTYQGRAFREDKKLLESLDKAAETFVGHPVFLRRARESVSRVKEGPP